MKNYLINVGKLLVNDTRLLESLCKSAQWSNLEIVLKHFICNNKVKIFISTTSNVVD